MRCYRRPVAISFSWGLNHPRVCRAWRPVSLERRVLVIEVLERSVLGTEATSDQHIALASASGKREVCCGPQHINRLKRIKRSVHLLGNSLRVEDTSGVY